MRLALFLDGLKHFNRTQPHLNIFEISITYTTYIQQIIMQYIVDFFIYDAHMIFARRIFRFDLKFISLIYIQQ